MQLQSEFYTEQSPDDPMKLELAWDDAMKEQPTHVVFNGRVGALTEPDNMLQVPPPPWPPLSLSLSSLHPIVAVAHQVNTGERVRIYFGTVPRRFRFRFRFCFRFRFRSFL
jgi:hypothetical protein